MIPLEAWIKLLEKYLLQAEKSVESGSAEDRQTVRAKILAFIKSTPPQYEFLDDIARNAIHNLNNASLEIASNGVKNAANELEKQRLIISIATNEAQKDATEIKLAQLTEKIDQTTKALENLKDVNAILNDDDKIFSQKIKDIQSKLKDLKELA